MLDFHAEKGESDGRRVAAETVERVHGELEEHYEELHGVGDRAAAILAAAYFEDKLKEAIKRNFLQETQEVAELFVSGKKILRRGDGAVDPTQSFASKIEIGFALGLYSDKVRRKLYGVRKVRNEFAHSPRAITFNHKEIKDTCENIKPVIISDRGNMRGRLYCILESNRAKHC